MRRSLIVEKDIKELISLDNNAILYKLCYGVSDSKINENEMDFLNLFFDDLKDYYKNILIKNTYKNDKEIVNICKGNFFFYYAVWQFTKDIMSNYSYKGYKLQEKEEGYKFILSDECISLYKIALLAVSKCTYFDSKYLVQVYNCAISNRYVGGNK